MKTIRQRILSIGAVASVSIGIALSGGIAANAASPEPAITSITTDESADWEAQFPDGSKYLSGRGFVPKPGTVEARLLNPFDWLSCNNPKDPRHVITSWNSKYQGKVALQCGSAKTSGYNHISARHKTEWQNLITRFGGGRSWDDFMAYVSISALNNPSAIYGAGFEKICYTAPINMINHKNGDKVTLSPSVIISSNNKIVITSYPGGKCR